MKKNFKIFFLVVATGFFTVPPVFAADVWMPVLPAAQSSPSSPASPSGSAAPSGSEASKKGGEGGSGSFVYVTERIPGANCVLKEGSSTDVTKRLYKCTVGEGFGTITGMLGSLIKYATYLTGLIGVLMIVLSGIQYSLSGGGEDAKKAKGRVIQLVAGLVLLFLVGMILNTVAPWVYK